MGQLAVLTNSLQSSMFGTSSPVLGGYIGKSGYLTGYQNSYLVDIIMRDSVVIIVGGVQIGYSR